MPTGKIKFFNKKKKYGFIIKDDDGKDIFFHLTGISDPILRNDIFSSQNVNFSIMKEEKGEKAVNIRLELRKIGKNELSS